MNTIRKMSKSELIKLAKHFVKCPFDDCGVSSPMCAYHEIADDKYE